MTEGRSVSRTLLHEFENISEEKEADLTPPKLADKSHSGTSEDEYTPAFPKRDYETRTRSKLGSTNVKQDFTGKKSSLKPRLENSLGELTK